MCLEINFTGFFFKQSLQWACGRAQGVGGSAGTEHLLSCAGARLPAGEIALPHRRQRFACAWEAAERPCRGAPIISAGLSCESALAALYSEELHPPAGLLCCWPDVRSRRDRAGGEGSPSPAPPLPGPALPAWRSGGPGEPPHLASWQVQRPWGWGVWSAVLGDTAANVSAFPAFCVLV